MPEVSFGEPLLRSEDTEEKMAHIMAKMNRLNSGATDGFMKMLLAERTDLRGMPFLLGKDCRTEENQAIVFASVVQAIHSSIQSSFGDEQGPKFPRSEQTMAERFWKAMETIIKEKRVS